MTSIIVHNALGQYRVTVLPKHLLIEGGIFSPNYSKSQLILSRDLVLRDHPGTRKAYNGSRFDFDELDALIEKREPYALQMKKRPPVLPARASAQR